MAAARQVDLEGQFLGHLCGCNAVSIFLLEDLLAETHGEITLVSLGQVFG